MPPMTAMITCKMLCHSNSPHLSQIFTGFALLDRAGAIALSQECRRRDYYDVTKPQYLRDAARAHLLVIVNGKIKLYYDAHDSYEIEENAARDADFYFKRSYAPCNIPSALKTKIHPLGFNYPVYTTGPDCFELQRALVFERASSNSSNRFRPTFENIRPTLRGALRPKILFMTRAWDPFDDPERTDEKI